LALLHKAALAMAPSGFVAALAGWISIEVGRQPYVIYGLVRSAAAASPLDAPAPASSLLAFIIVYFMAFVGGTLFPIFDVWREHDRAMNSVAPVWDGTIPGWC
jgi:cytochrome d ubiquinol oxidase subunit I